MLKQVGVDPARDIYGVEVFVGDRIAAAMLAGRSAELRTGVIRSFRVGKAYHGATYKMDVEWELECAGGDPHRSWTKHSLVDAWAAKFIRLGTEAETESGLDTDPDSVVV